MASDYLTAAELTRRLRPAPETVRQIARDGCNAALYRARAEVRLLACTAPIRRWGMAVASCAGITIDDPKADDTRAILAGLIVANRLGRIVDRRTTVRLIAGGAE